MPFFIIDCLSRNSYFNFAHVNLNSTNIHIRGFDALVDSIVCFPELRSLTVRSNSLPKEAGMSLAKILGARASLQVLDARDNNLSDAGVAAISGAFTADLSDLSNSVSISLLSLTVLDLSGNHVGDAGLLALCRGLTHFGRSSRSCGRASSLQVLRLANNKIGDKAAVCLAQFLESYYCTGHFPLEELSLSGNPIGRTGMVAVLDSIQSAPAKNATLMKLSMEKCHPALEVLEEAGLRILELAMGEAEATEMCNSEAFLDTIVALSDAVAANEHIAVLTLGELPDTTRRQTLTAAPGTARYYGLRVAMDCFRSMLEVLRMAAHQQRQFLTSLENGQPVSVLKLQQDEFQKLRREHT
ncbi:Nlrp12, partial [Symbiodinium microadriaticum]